MDALSRDEAPPVGGAFVFGAGLLFACGGVGALSWQRGAGCADAGFALCVPFPCAEGGGRFGIPLKSGLHPPQLRWLGLVWVVKMLSQERSRRSKLMQRGLPSEVQHKRVQIACSSGRGIFSQVRF